MPRNSVCPKCLTSRDVRYRPRLHNCICDRCNVVFRSKDSPKPKGGHTYCKVTDAQILEAIQNNPQSTKQMAATFKISERTVKHHIASMVNAGKVRMKLDIPRDARVRLYFVDSTKPGEKVCA